MLEVIICNGVATELKVAALSASDEYPHMTLRHIFFPVARPLQQFLGRLEKNAVLRINASGVNFTDMEKIGGKQIHVLDVTAPFRVALVIGRFIRAVVLRDRPSVDRNL